MLKAKSLRRTGSENTKAACLQNDVNCNCEITTTSGKLVFWVKESFDVSDDYTESVMYEKVERILDELSLKYRKEYRIYRNAGYTEGHLRLLFHLVFEFDGTFYMILKKNSRSGDNWKKVKKIGNTYKISPKRLLLLDESVSSEYANVLECFCDYYITNLTDESLRRKIFRMIENALEEGGENGDL